MLNISYEKKTTHINIDDGKVNALTFELVDAIIEEINKAHQKKHKLSISGRTSVFCAGYDMKTILISHNKAQELIHHGFKLLSILYTYPYPTIATVEGHAVGLGAFILCCCDYVIGIDKGGFIQCNEVKNKMHIPSPLMDIAIAKLNPKYYDRILTCAEKLDFTTAKDAGFIDQLVDDQKKAMDILKAKLEEFEEIGLEGYKITKNHLAKCQGDIKKAFAPYHKTHNRRHL